ncbi:MAG: 4'-phosphopantetheinyl transferase superfamily protein [Gloeobacteraceae cyanobacterium ES-bin-316]|nr:4'-phosphopantetheinyl transferase superfamily protein [Ferruginibacter sp.]
MPLVYQQNINAFTRLGVWHIAEPESFFLKKVSLQNNITHPHKRLQHLAGRILLKELYEDFPLELIMVANTKKPFLADDAYHFSISHCGDYAAAIVSKRSRVGVDIEIPQQKIERISHKFLSPEEIQVLNINNHDPHYMLTLAWSIKETIFKWYGSGQVDFREHMHINECKAAGNQFTARCSFLKHAPVHFNVTGIFFNGTCLTWLAT